MNVYISPTTYIVMAVGPSAEFPPGVKSRVLADVSDTVCESIISLQRAGDTVYMDPITLEVTSTPLIAPLNPIEVVAQSLASFSDAFPDGTATELANHVISNLQPLLGGNQAVPAPHTVTETLKSAVEKITHPIGGRTKKG